MQLTTEKCLTGTDSGVRPIVRNSGNGSASTLDVTLRPTARNSVNSNVSGMRPTERNTVNSNVSGMRPIASGSDYAVRRTARNTPSETDDGVRPTVKGSPNWRHCGGGVGAARRPQASEGIDTGDGAEAGSASAEAVAHLSVGANQAR